MQLATSASAVIRTTEIGIVHDNGVVTIVPVEWFRGMAVLDGLKSAARKPYGITFRASGDIQLAFVVEIDGQTNDSDGNWMYWVNGELARLGCGSFVLKPGDIVRWEFVANDPTAR